MDREPAASPARPSAGPQPPPVFGPDPPACVEADGPPLLMRRLTNAEYLRTLRDLLLIPASDPIDDRLPAETVSEGVAGLAETQTLSTLHARAYGVLADRLVKARLTSPAARGPDGVVSFVGCDPSPPAAAVCLRAFVARFGRRAYRRPLTEGEVEGLLALATAADPAGGPYAAIGLVARAILRSPHFLFRLETGAPVAGRPGLSRLTGFERASRLSYLVLGTGPDDALLEAASAGALDTTDGLLGAVDRLLADARAKDHSRSFAAAWLALDKAAQAAPAPALFPHWNKELALAAQGETLRLTEDVFWRSGARLRDLFTARHTFVNGALASFYGLPAPASGWARAALDGLPERVGLLTSMSVLIGTSLPTRTSPTFRGKYVREHLLCQRVPPPPPEVPSLEEADVPAEPTAKQRLDAHAADPACAGCHRLLDPVGLPFEVYDATGAYRPRDSLGRPIATTGRIEGLPEPAFDGVPALAAKLAVAPELESCLVTQAFRFGFGQREPESEPCWLREARQAFARGDGSYRSLVRAYVASPAFGFRQAPEGGGR